jgi:neutral ceramidase
MTRSVHLFATAGLAWSAFAATPAAAKAGDFMAGAAKVDITPPASVLPPGDSIRDHLFVRAIVISNGASCAVLVGADQGGIRDAVAKPAIARAAKATGCAADNFVVSATHTHSGSTGPRDAIAPGPKMVEDAIVDAVAQAKARLKPARLGYGTTMVDLNTNRDLFANDRWAQAANPTGSSDKTLAVIELVGDDGLPIAAYLNYAMHPIDFYLSGVVSADFAGEASRYVERRYGPEMVAIFAQGASGDQNPKLLRPMNKLIQTRTASPTADDMRLTTPPPWMQETAERNAVTRMNEAIKAPVPADRQTAYASAIAVTNEIVTAMGAIIGESAINTMRYYIPSLSSSGPINGASQMFQCPGRDRQDKDNPIREGALPPYADGVPVDIRVGMVRIGDLYVGAVNGEVYSEIAIRLKHEAPVSQLIVTTLADGAANSGYIYSNNAGSHLTFQVIGSRLKPNCAEDKVVGAGLSLIDQLHK